MRPTVKPTRTLPDLLAYLQEGRDVLLLKLDGLGEYDLRRPLTPTGTNLLGLVKHLTFVELGYFGAVFGRPAPAARRARASACASLSASACIRDRPPR